MTPWPHQEFAVSETLAAIARGERRICITSPTGGGKTWVMSELIRRYLDQDKRVVLYTNRKLLIEQTSKVLSAAGLRHGVRANGYDDNRHRDLQISSLQTEHARVLRAGTWELHSADLVLIDEAHLQKGDIAKTILDAHHLAGAVYVGLTATPLDIGHLYDHLIVAGTTSELRGCGALVPCHHYGPDEPDLRHIGKVALGEDLSEKQNRKAIMTQGVFGRVIGWLLQLNPELRPGILFAPGVPESLWFAERLHNPALRETAEERALPAVAAAHIDGEMVWVNGKLYRSSKNAREDVLEMSKDGRIRVICNRFVLREGIDCPWLAHGIFATVFGSLQSYLQSGGRLLRAYPGLQGVTLQDHGGNWWRHGSLNADREWRLEYTAHIVAGLRDAGFRNPPPGERPPPEPFSCPVCRRILTSARCPCGWTATSHRKSRAVIQADGSMKEMRGSIFKPRRVTKRPDAAAIWERMYYRSLKAGRTFAAAEALFAMENNWGWPSRELPLMPTEPMDFFRKVSDVPRERLRPSHRQADCDQSGRE